MTLWPTRILNFAFYQVGWFLCVLGAASGWSLAGAFGALALVGVHLMLCTDRGGEAKLLLASGLAGLGVDGLQQALGLIRFHGVEPWPLPLWVFVIWVQFATLLRFCLDWMRRRYGLAALFGLVGGPLAYWAGIRLGAATPFGLASSLIYLAVAWSLAMPLLLVLREKIAPAPGAYHSLWRLRTHPQQGGGRGGRT